MTKNSYRKRDFKSLGDLDSYRRKLKTKRNTLKQEIVQDITNPVNIVMSVSKNIISKFGALKKKSRTTTINSSNSLIEPQNKNNVLHILSSILDIKSFSLLALLKFFFKKVKKTNWFKWQLIFILYSIVSRVLIRRKKSKQAANPTK